MESWRENTEQAMATALAWLTSPAFYAQVALVAASFFLAYSVGRFVRSWFKRLETLPEDGPGTNLKSVLLRSRELVFPILAIVLLGFAIQISLQLFGRAFVVRIGQSLAVILLLYTFVSHFVSERIIVKLTKWVGIPVALLYVFGWLDDVTGYLDQIALELGNISFSAFDLARTIIFGTVLFWLGRISNQAGQHVIRSQPSLDAGTQELLLQVAGINLTTLAVFGGALGVGLGFGLQQIASNFISGIIILLDRSITIGDFIELEDGRAGTIREMNMRCATLETFNGKDIIVPNETFITSVFTNWTHNNKKQRYSLEFSVAYKTDLPPMFEIIRKVVASHPQVISGPDVPVAERPDAEISSFGDSGINILVEFWMEGIDDGDNRVGADLLLMIWTTLRENGIEIPFPQREVKLLPGSEAAVSTQAK
jgi:small-conductance mechanosensitive channel